MAATDEFSELNLGDFEKPLAPPPKKTVQPAGSSEKQLSSAEEQLAQAAQEAEQNLAPLERYEQSLKRLKITRDEAAQIVDTILTQGYWSKELPITPRCKVRFRSRLYSDTRRFLDYVEAVQPRNPSNYNELLYKYSLAASLEKFDKRVFGHPKDDADEAAVEDSFKKRLTFVEKCADSVVRVLYAKLHEFDEIVRVVMEEGAAENF